jgi:hypothetical protein
MFLFSDDGWKRSKSPPDVGTYKLIEITTVCKGWGTTKLEKDAVFDNVGEVWIPVGTIM